MANKESAFFVFGAGFRNKFDRDNYDAIIMAARSVIARSGHKPHIPANIEFWSAVIARDHAVPIAVVDADLDMPESLAVQVRALRHATATPDWPSITALMHAYPQHIRFEPGRPNYLSFDAEAAGASETIRHMLRRHHLYASDLAAEVLHDVDPVRNQMRLGALANLRASRR